MKVGTFMATYIHYIHDRFRIAIDAARVARIQRLPLAQAEALAEALLDFQTPADLAAWLADQERGGSQCF